MLLDSDSDSEPDSDTDLALETSSGVLTYAGGHSLSTDH